jgi:hypothetical protein
MRFGRIGFWVQACLIATTLWSVTKVTSSCESGAYYINCTDVDQLDDVSLCLKNCLVRHGKSGKIL